MTKMKRALTGIAFSAVLALSLVASAGEAFAATLSTRDGGIVVDGQGQKNKPTSPKPAGLPRSLGVTWEGITWE